MNSNILPIIHKFNLISINPNKFCWGWRSQKEIRKILVNTSNIKYQPHMFNEEIMEKTIIDEISFQSGSKEAYKRIYESFYKKDNFLKKKYTTPELSLAINHIIKNKKKFKNIQIKNLESKVLTSWIEVGNATANNKLLGYWDCKYIQKEIKNSNITNCWDIYVGPLKQKVKVLYKTDNRIDIWELERCLMQEDSEWNISNINEILV